MTSIAEQLQVIKHTISELVSSKNDHINSVSSEDKMKSKAQHAQNDAGNAFGGRRAKSYQGRQLPSGLTILSYIFSLAAYWFPPRHRTISRKVSSVRNRMSAPTSIYITWSYRIGYTCRYYSIGFELCCPVIYRKGMQGFSLLITVQSGPERSCCHGGYGLD